MHWSQTHPLQKLLFKIFKAWAVDADWAADVKSYTSQKKVSFYLSAKRNCVCAHQGVISVWICMLTRTFFIRRTLRPLCNMKDWALISGGRLKMFLTRLSMGMSEPRATGNHGLLGTHRHKQACFPHPEEYKPGECM